jgi:hypothetical protein
VPLRPRNRKPADGRAHAVATILAHYYQLMTGRGVQLSVSSSTGKRSGPFYRLLREVFGAMRLSRSTEHYAIQAKQRVSKG